MSVVDLRLQVKPKTEKNVDFIRIEATYNTFYKYKILFTETWYWWVSLYDSYNL